MTDPDRVAAEAAVKAIREPRTMHPCPDPHCPNEYVLPADGGIRVEGVELKAGHTYEIRGGRR